MAAILDEGDPAGKDIVLTDPATSDPAEGALRVRSERPLAGDLDRFGPTSAG